MNIATPIATSVNMSPSPATTPEVKSSFRVSTSDVTRVMSRPAGLRSKNETERRWRCEKICMRRSRMTLWPSRLVSIASPNEQPNWASSTTRKMIEDVMIAPPSRAGSAVSMTY